MSFRTFVVGLMMSSTAGCSVLSPSAESTSSLFGDRYINQLTQDYFDENSKFAKKNGGISGINYWKGEFNKLVYQTSPPDLTTAKALRNDVIAELMTISDYIYSKQKDAIVNGRAGMDTSFDVANLLLTGTATAIGGGIRAKTNLAAAATFLQGTKQSISKNFFASQAISAVIASMDAERARVKTVVIGNQEKSAVDFTLEQAIALVREYHRAGSMIDAVVRINQASSSSSVRQQGLLEDAEKKAASQQGK